MDAKVETRKRWQVNKLSKIISCTAFACGCVLGEGVAGGSSNNSSALVVWLVVFKTDYCFPSLHRMMGAQFDDIRSSALVPPFMLLHVDQLRHHLFWDHEMFSWAVYKTPKLFYSHGINRGHWFFFGSIIGLFRGIYFMFPKNPKTYDVKLTQFTHNNVRSTLRREHVLIGPIGHGNGTHRHPRQAWKSLPHGGADRWGARAAWGSAKMICWWLFMGKLCFF